MDFSISNFKFIQKKSCGSFTLSIRSFTLQKGEIIFVYGGSGSGKTTFFNLITGVKKSELAKMVRLSFPRIEYVMHESKLLPWHRLRDNINVINKLNGIISVDNVINIVKKIGLDEHVLEMKPWQLSLGMRQRIEIAIAIANKPDLILFDEALSGIDNKHKILTTTMLYDYIKTNNVSFVGTAHQISDILRLAERVIFIKNGLITGQLCIVSKSVEQRLKMSLDELYALPEAKQLIEINQ